jgi:ADP-heptose:LPS heptosyltransferase
LLTILLALIERLIGEVDPGTPLAACRKVLMVDPAFIGDMVRSTPAYRAVKERIPGVRLDAMIFEAGRPVFRHNPNVDELHVIPRRSLIGQLRTVLRLRRERYDVIINLYTGLRMNFYCWLIGAPLRVGYNFRHRGCFHNRRVPIATRTVQTIYRPEECLILLERAFGWTIGERNMVFSVFDEDRRAVDEVLGRLGCGPGDVLVGFHTNCVSRRDEKLWEDGRFAGLADEMIRKYGVKIVFTGSEADRSHVDSIITLVRNREGVVSTVGLVNLSQLGALLRRFALFVTLDTGPLHISIAVDTPTFALVGGVPLDLGIPPGRPRFRGLVAGAFAPSGPASLSGFSVQDVGDAIERMRGDLDLFSVRGL